MGRRKPWKYVNLIVQKMRFEEFNIMQSKEQNHGSFHNITLIYYILL